MVKKENLSDMMKPAAYTDKDENGKYIFHVGKVLKFSYEGSPIHIKITKIDRKNQKMYGEHIDLVDFDTGMSHYGHIVVDQEGGKKFCTDCNVPISEPGTEEGEVKAIERQKAEAAEEEKQEEKRDRNRRFRYVLLRQDGTKKEFAAGKRKRLSEMYKILNCKTVEVIPGAYYKEPYVGQAIGYGDEEARFNSDNVRNPHFLVLAGDVAEGEPEEWDVVGDILMEIEVIK